VKEENNKTLVHIADMGGAKQADKIRLNDIFNHTAQFVPDTDAQKFLEFRGRRNLRSNTEWLNQNEWIKVNHATDVFAMGTVLYQALEGTEEFPYDIGQFGRQLEDSQEYREIKNSDVPDEIKKLIKGMLDPDYTKRLTAAEAFQTLEEYMSQKCPEVLQEVDRYRLVNK